MDKNQTWGGRFDENTNDFVKRFTASITFDKKLAKYDIQASKAHAKMLCKIGVINQEEATILLDNLTKILKEIEANNFVFSQDLEDIHMNIEARLIERCGDIGKKLHTARSRNDQVATDIRLYLRDESKTILKRIQDLQLALLDLAEKHAGTVMPGFTHLQAAQVISFGHHLMAYVEMLSRDYERLSDSLKRINTLPLGAAALAGSRHPIDRQYVADLLGFERICDNSLDAVSDRDFMIEFSAFASTLMMHLSRFSEEIIIWSSAQFNFIELSDAFCTGSSIMPQKKNPDLAELIRGKTARTYGHLTTFLTLMKGQPLAYNKDNQEDKEPLFDCVETIKDCLFASTEMLTDIKVNQAQMYQSAKLGFTTATDLADYLVTKKIAFRDAHHCVGAIVAYCLKQQKSLDTLTLDELKQFHPSIDNDAMAYLTLENSLNSRNHLGATAPEQVKKMIDKKRQQL